MTEKQIAVDYFCEPDKIDENAKAQLDQYSKMPGLEKLCAFPDIHFCDEKAIPVGVAFSTRGIFYPLVTGKDVGCGVGYARIGKKYLLKPFDKSKHYNALERAHRDMTDEGLGGGNHFLSLEEDDEYLYVICHTGTRNRGIALYQEGYQMVKEYSNEIGEEVKYVSWEWMREKHPEYLMSVLRIPDYATKRRADFVFKTITFLQKNGYLENTKPIEKDYLSRDYWIKSIMDEYHPDLGIPGKEWLPKTKRTPIEINGIPYEWHDSMHNHLEFKEDGSIIHRKGSTEINPGDEVAIPLSMTRGTLIVKVHPFHDITGALNSCSHGAGRKLSRFDSMKHWRTVLKAKERKAYEERFSELLDKSGKFPSGYLQEFDYAYKDSSDILTMQPYLRKVTQTIPIVTIKYTEI